jgi:hypothetical protein
VCRFVRQFAVLFVGHPAFGREKSDVRIFKLDADGSYAVRTRVKLGRSSVNTKPPGFPHRGLTAAGISMDYATKPPEPFPC